MKERLFSLRRLLRRRPDPERVRALLARHVASVQVCPRCAPPPKLPKPTTCELDEHLVELLRWDGEE